MAKLSQPPRRKEEGAVRVCRWTSRVSFTPLVLDFLFPPGAVKTCVKSRDIPPPRPRARVGANGTRGGVLPSAGGGTRVVAIDTGGSRLVNGSGCPTWLRFARVVVPRASARSASLPSTTQPTSSECGCAVVSSDLAPCCS